MISFEGKVVIVTGSAQGIGAASAENFAALGGSVVVADINGWGAKEEAEKIVASGGTAIAVETDVRVEDQVARMVATAVDTYGRLDVLHNNAGAMDLIPRDVDIVNMEEEIFHGMIRTNTLGPLLGCKYAIPAMLRSGGGAIVNTASVSGKMGELNMTAYGASKAANAHVARMVAAQYGKQGIRCNAVSPGLVLTPASLAALPQEVLDIYVRHSLTPYVGQPEDVAHAVAFLASDGARYITAQVLDVDGGLATHHPIIPDFADFVAAQSA